MTRSTVGKKLSVLFSLKHFCATIVIDIKRFLDTCMVTRIKENGNYLIQSFCVLLMLGVIGEYLYKVFLGTYLTLTISDFFWVLNSIAVTHSETFPPYHIPFRTFSLT